MWFALSKFHEIKKFERMDKINVLDQAVLNIRAYTNMLFGNEDPEALDIINQCFNHLEGKLGKPDLLINLKCSPQEQLRRIRGRNRDHERGVQLDYIAALQQEMNILIHQAREDGYAVFDIDTESVFFPDNIEYAETLAGEIADMFKLDLSAILDHPHGVQYGLPVGSV